MAAERGADLLGFVFAPAQRQIEPTQARGIVSQLGNGPDRVGLFVNESPGVVNRVADDVGLDYVQLCGDEPPEYVDEIDRPTIKSIAVDDAGSFKTAEKYHRRGARVLFDAHVHGQRGGTGVSFDWSIFERDRPGFPFMLAGGLNPDNVGKAISTARPWGVDVSSGVEIGGRKSSELIAEFIRTVRSGPI